MLGSLIQALSDRDDLGGDLFGIIGCFCVFAALWGGVYLLVIATTILKGEVDQLKAHHVVFSLMGLFVGGTLAFPMFDAAF